MLDQHSVGYYRMLMPRSMARSGGLALSQGAYFPCKRMRKQTGVSMLRELLLVPQEILDLILKRIKTRMTEDEVNHPVLLMRCQVWLGRGSPPAVPGTGPVAGA